MLTGHFLLVLTSLVAALSVVLSKDALPPVLFLPGYGSSKLYCMFDSEKSIPATCEDGKLEAGKKYLIEEDGTYITNIDCVYDLLQLNFDPRTLTYSSPEGVHVFTESMGSFSGIDTVYSPFQSALESWGYKEGVNLFAVPYDYRLMSDRSLSSVGFIRHLKSLVENAYHNNGGRKVLLAGHSNGGPTMYTFLQSSLISRNWKTMYVAGMIGLSGNFLGQMNMIRDFTHHDNPKQQNMTCSWEATVGSITWGGYDATKDVPIVTTGFGTTSERNFTAKVEDLAVLFTESGHSDWAQQLKALSGISPSKENTMDRSRHPEVDTFCLFGSNISTSYSFRFSGDAMSSDPAETLFMEGDDNQEIFDNSFCNVWASTKEFQQFYFEAKAFPNVHHMDMISDSAVLEEIHRIIQRYS